MAKKNTGTKTAVITNKPVQTTQTIKVQPNGSKVIVEKDKSVVPTTTAKDKTLHNPDGTPRAEVDITRTVKDITTAVTRTVINKQGQVVKQTVDVKTGKNVVVVRNVQPYSSPDIGVQIPTPIGPKPNAGQGDQIISYPDRGDNGQYQPPVDNSDDDYIDVGSIATTANGSLLAQTWRSPRDGYVSKVRFYLSDVGANGDMILNLCATQQTGEPFLGLTYASKTIAFADLKRGWNEVIITPVLVQKGKLYAFQFMSTGSHTFLIAIGGNFSLGTYFDSQDQSWFKGNLDEDLALPIFFAEFTNLQTITSMEPLSLDGGIGAAMFRLFELLPEGTQRTLQGQLNGVWTDLMLDSNDYPFGNLPAQVLLRQVLSGTKDLMPATNHDVSRSITYRNRGEFKGVTKLITTGVAVTAAKVKILMHNYKEADHNCAIKILKADNTVVNHATVSDTLTDDPLIIERTATFTFTSMSSFRIRVDGESNSPLSSFGVSEIIYSAT